MRAQFAVITASLLIALTSPASARPAGDSAATAFQKLADAWTAAYNSGDSTQLAEMYAPEARYVSGHVQGLVAEGREKVIANFRKGVRMGGHIDAVRVLSVECSCDLAALYCAYEATNSGQKARGRNILIVRREGERWRIILHMTVV